MDTEYWCCRQGLEAYSYTDFAAWIGAVVAMLVFCWEIYNEIKSGARLGVKAKPNWRYFNGESLSSEPHISVTVVNKGNLPTTLTHLIVYMYASHVMKILNKPAMNGAVLEQPVGFPQMPHVLQPGGIWYGEIKQQQILRFKEKYDAKLFYIAVAHASSEKQTKVRLHFSKLNAESELDVMDE